MVPWHILSDADTVDEALHTFESLVSDIWDTHAPRKRKQRRRKPTPWIMPTVLGQMRTHNKIYFSFLRNRTDANWMAYKQSRDHANKLIRDAERAYLLSAASYNQNFWRTISHCTSLGRKRHIDPPWPWSTSTICKITSNAAVLFTLKLTE